MGNTGDVRGSEVLDGQTSGVRILHPGSRLVVEGEHQGAVIVYSGATLIVRGLVVGGVQVFPGGVAVIDGGSHQGQLNNEGHLSIG